jgi:hypothetical protein
MKDREVMRYGGFEPVRDTTTGEIVALLPLVGPYDGPPPPRRPRRSGWWLLCLVAWDSAFARRATARQGYCTHCGEELHRDGYCTPYPDKREDIL